MKTSDFNIYVMNYDCLACGERVDEKHLRQDRLEMWETDLGRRFFCLDCTQKRQE